MAQRLPPLEIDARNVSLGSLTAKYEVGQVIGTGSFGKAILARSIEREHLVVIKQIKIADLSERERQEAVTEVKLLSQFDHVNVIKYYECIVEDGTLNIVMEYAKHGELGQQIAARASQGNPFTEDEVMFWFVQIAAGLCHVHSKSVLHRDLKSQNIFIAEGNILKLGDFGIARMMRNEQDLARTAIGTPYYLSPEICEDKPYNSKSDVWALGCVLYELCTLRKAFDGHSLPALVVKILRGKYPAIPSLYTEPVRKLIDSMLTQNPKNRPSVDAILRNEFVQNHLARYAKHIMKMCRNRGSLHGPILDTLSEEHRKALELPTTPPTPPRSDRTMQNNLRSSIDRGGITSLIKIRSPPAKPPEESEDEPVKNTYQLNLWKVYGQNPRAMFLGHVGKPPASAPGQPDSTESGPATVSSEASQKSEESQKSEDSQKSSSSSSGSGEGTHEGTHEGTNEGTEETVERQEAEVVDGEELDGADEGDDWPSRSPSIKARHKKRLITNSWLVKQQTELNAIMAALADFKRQQADPIPSVPEAGEEAGEVGEEEGIDDEELPVMSKQQLERMFPPLSQLPAPLGGQPFAQAPPLTRQAPRRPPSRPAIHPPAGLLSQPPPAVPSRRPGSVLLPPVALPPSRQGVEPTPAAKRPAPYEATSKASTPDTGVKSAVLDVLSDLRALQEAQAATRHRAVSRSKAAAQSNRAQQARSKTAAAAAQAIAKRMDRELDTLKVEKNKELQLLAHKREEDRRRRDLDALAVHQRHLEHMRQIQPGINKADLTRLGSEFAKRASTPNGSDPSILILDAPPRAAGFDNGSMNHVVRKTLSQGPETSAAHPRVWRVSPPRDPHHAPGKPKATEQPTEHSTHSGSSLHSSDDLSAMLPGKLPSAGPGRPTGDTAQGLHQEAASSAPVPPLRRTRSAWVKPSESPRAGSSPGGVDGPAPPAPAPRIPFMGSPPPLSPAPGDRARRVWSAGSRSRWDPGPAAAGCVGRIRSAVGGALATDVEPATRRLAAKFWALPTRSALGEAQQQLQHATAGDAAPTATVGNGAPAAGSAGDPGSLRQPRRSASPPWRRKGGAKAKGASAAAREGTFGVQIFVPYGSLPPDGDHGDGSTHEETKFIAPQGRGACAVGVSQLLDSLHLEDSSVRTLWEARGDRPALELLSQIQGVLAPPPPGPSTTTLDDDAIPEEPSCCTGADPSGSSRMEVLRASLEQQLGEDKFFGAYRLLRQLHEDAEREDCGGDGHAEQGDGQLRELLGTSLGLVNQINRLILMEDAVF